MIEIICPNPVGTADALTTCISPTEWQNRGAIINAIADLVAPVITEAVGTNSCTPIYLDANGNVTSNPAEMCIHLGFHLGQGRVMMAGPTACVRVQGEVNACDNLSPLGVGMLHASDANPIAVALKPAQDECVIAMMVAPNPVSTCLTRCVDVYGTIGYTNAAPDGGSLDVAPGATVEIPFNIITGAGLGPDTSSTPNPNAVQVTEDRDVLQFNLEGKVWHKFQNPSSVGGLKIDFKVNGGNAGGIEKADFAPAAALTHGAGLGSYRAKISGQIPISVGDLITLCMTNTSDVTLATGFYTADLTLRDLANKCDCNGVRVG